MKSIHINRYAIASLVLAICALCFVIPAIAQDEDSSLIVDRSCFRDNWTSAKGEDIDRKVTKPSLDYFNEVLERFPDNYLALEGRSNLYARSGDYQAALEDQLKVVKMLPDYDLARNNLGQSYLFLGEYELALENYDKAIELNPKFSVAILGRSRVYAAMGDYVRAETDAIHTINIYERYADAYCELGNYYYAQERYFDTFSAYSKYIKLVDGEYNSVIDTRLDEADQRQYEESPVAPPSLIEFDANQSAEAYYNLGFAESLNSKFEKAVIAYTFALQLDPDFIDAYYRRGLYYATGAFDSPKTVSDFTRVIEAEPANPVAHHYRGFANLQLENYQEAMSDFEIVTALNPSNYVAYRGLGDAYYALNKNEEALAAYKTYVSLAGEKANSGVFALIKELEKGNT